MVEKISPSRSLPPYFKSFSRFPSLVSRSSFSRSLRFGRSRRGTGLVEMIGAFFLLSLGLVALSQVGMYGIHANATAAYRTGAALLAQEKMAEIMAARNDREYLAREFALGASEEDSPWRTADPIRGRKLGTKLEYRSLFEEAEDNAGLYTVTLEVQYNLAVRRSLMGTYRLVSMLSLPPKGEGGK